MKFNVTYHIHSSIYHTQSYNQKKQNKMIKFNCLHGSPLFLIFLSEFSRKKSQKSEFSFDGRPGLDMTLYRVCDFRQKKSFVSYESGCVQTFCIYIFKFYLLKKIFAYLAKYFQRKILK